MDSVQTGRGRIPGIASMTLVLLVALPWALGITSPFWFIVLVIAMALGIAAVIMGGKGSEYGIVGLAVGLVLLIALLLGITL